VEDACAAKLISVEKRNELLLGGRKKI